MIAIGTGTAITASVVMMMPQVPHQAPAASTLNEHDRRDVFNKNALKWDGMVRWTEISGGLWWWRRKLARQAYGDVLEVAVGSGRNFQYYDKNKVKSLTAVDYSRPMLEVALKKKRNISTRFICSKVDELARHFPLSSQFDCVLDTFGICSFDEPVAALREMSRLCKPDGRILLLEHGDSTWQWLSRYLSNHLTAHVCKYGCYHNRPIREIVEEAGLEIIFEKRKHFGSLYLLVCKPAP